MQTASKAKPQQYLSVAYLACLLQKLQQGCTAVQGIILAQEISKMFPSKFLQLLQETSLFSPLASKVQLRQVHMSLTRRDQLSKESAGPWRNGTM